MEKAKLSVTMGDRLILILEGTIDESKKYKGDYFFWKKRDIDIDIFGNKLKSPNSYTIDCMQKALQNYLSREGHGEFEVRH